MSPLFMAEEHASPVSDPTLSQTWRSWIAGRARTFFLYARQQTQTEEDAHDVLQDSLFEAWRRTAEGRSEEHTSELQSPC